jgi:hypothetical protein
VPDSVRRAYGVERLEYGKEYIIPKPFDPRVLIWEAAAVALMLRDRILFVADTTVNIEPGAEDLAEIALLTAGLARRFGVTPRVAMISFSNFGSNRHPSALKVRDAVEILHRTAPGARGRRRDAGRHRGRSARSSPSRSPGRG